MSPLSTLLLVGACAALLQVGCEARHDRERHRPPHLGGSGAVNLGYCDPNALYKITVPLPTRVYPGPENRVDVPDVCRAAGLTPACTELVLTNNSGGPPPGAQADRPYDPLSPVRMRCVWEASGRCPAGVSVSGVQKCV